MRNTRTAFSIALIALAATRATAQPRECPTAALLAGETVSAALEATDCRLSDLVSGTTSTALAKRYRIETAEKAVFTFTMVASGFTPALAILTSQGRVVGTNSATVVSGTARVTINLPAGAYNVITYALGTGASGTFELKAAGEPPRPCPTLDLPESGTLEGAFTASSCRFVDVNELSVSTANVVFYRYRMTRQAVLTITAETAITRFTTVLVTPALNGFPGARQLLISLAPGNQTVSVSSAETGSFTLRTKVDDLRECPQTPTKLGTEVTGTLAATGCRWLDQFIPSDDVTPIQLYRFSVDSRTIVRLDQTSPTVDSYLALINPRTLVGLATNNDAGAGSRDSRILIHLIPGDYVIIATAVDLTTLGDFTLRLAGDLPKSCEAQNLTSGATLDGTIPADGCRVLDYVGLSTVTDLVAPFRLEASAASLLAMKIEGAVSGTLRLITPQATEGVRQVVDRNGNLTVEVRVPAGAFNLLVTSSALTKPAFKLGAATRALPSCPSKELAPNAEAQGALTTVECKFSDLVNYTTLPSSAQPFLLTLPERGALTIELESAEFAPLLAVVTANGDFLGLAFASAPTRLALSNSQASGEVRIVVGVNGLTGVGAYALRNTFAPASTATPALVQPRQWRRVHESPGQPSRSREHFGVNPRGDALLFQ